MLPRVARTSQVFNVLVACRTTFAIEHFRRILLCYETSGSMKVYNVYVKRIN